MSPVADLIPGTGRERALSAIKASARPIEAVEVSRLIGLPLPQTRSRIADLIADKLVVNVAPKGATGFYEAAPPRDVEEVPTARFVPWRDSTYTGEKTGPVRPGAFDFLKCHSLVNGVRIERKRPALIAAMPERRY